MRQKAAALSLNAAAFVLSIWSELRTLTTGWSRGRLLGNHFLRALQLRQDCLRVGFQRVRVRRNVHKVLEVVGCFLELGLVLRSVERESRAEIRFGTVRLRSQD